jgi:tetratricopeptide (TPR) repeat protein
MIFESWVMPIGELDMPQTRRSRRDPIRGLIESALQPGRFIPYAEAFGFVAILEGVANQIQALLPSDPMRAVGLYEVLLAGCEKKAEDIDDSDDNLGMFAGDIICGWITARQAANADPDETVKKLLAWIDDDDYGFTSDIERDVAEALDRKGRQAFERQVRARFDAAGGEVWADTLRAIYLTQGDLNRYVELCNTSGLTPGDCEAIAGILQARRKFADAVEWVERGLDLQKAETFPMTGRRLADTKRRLLKKLGRLDEALTSAWDEFEAHPTKLSYAELMRYTPKGERPVWHEKAMAAAADSRLDSLIDLWLAAKETGRLAERLRNATNGELEAMSHYTTEPAAKRLAGPHPDAAAKVYRALGMRILNAGKSQYYWAALADFQEAKRCYAQAGLVHEWEALVLEVRRAHFRKYGFMPGFERIAASK